VRTVLSYFIPLKRVLLSKTVISIGPSKANVKHWNCSKWNSFVGFIVG
jgi:hypothetical protein